MQRVLLPCHSGCPGLSCHGQVVPTRTYLHGRAALSSVRPDDPRHGSGERQRRSVIPCAARSRKAAQSSLAAAAAVQQGCNMDELMRLLELLPPRFQDAIMTQPNLHELVEIVLGETMCRFRRKGTKIP